MLESRTLLKPIAIWRHQGPLEPCWEVLALTHLFRLLQQKCTWQLTVLSPTATRGHTPSPTMQPPPSPHLGGVERE